MPSNGNSALNPRRKYIGGAEFTAITAGGDGSSLSSHISSNNVHKFIPAQVGILGLQPQIAAIGPKPRITTINHDGGTIFAVGGDDHGQ